MIIRRATILALLVGSTVVSATSARAYTYQSKVSTGCHERIAITALRTVRKALPANAPIVTPSDNDRALIHDLPFDLDPDVRDLSGASLAIGVRDNDLKGRGPDELDSLAQVHGNPNTQREHCLRNPTEDEPNGTQAALEDCKAFIREKVTFALDGLDAKGVPDPAKTTEIGVTLLFRGKVSARIPQYWFAIGQALHTMEDSFTHNFRSEDHMRIRVTENYSDYVSGDLTESRDGPAHRAEMDKCENLDDYRATNLTLATKASTEILKLTLDPTMNREAKLAALENTLATYLTYEPGCTDGNRWCGAKENAYTVEPGCSIAGRSLAGSFVFAAGLSAAAIALGARRRRRFAPLAALALVLGIPSAAHAQEAPAPAPAAPAAPAAPPPDVDPSLAPEGTVTKQEVKAEQKNEQHRSRFAIYAGISGSITNYSGNGQLGGRINLSEHWQVGLDGELNGFYGSLVRRFTPGAFNAYGTVVYRMPLRFSPLNLRTTANLGTSTSLIDLYGVPKGSTGIFLGIAPLGIEWKLSSRVFLVLSGISLAVPIPKMTGGAPFAYPQYRLSAGVEIAL